MHFRNFAFAALLFVAGCATPSQRITKSLIDRGVPAPQARCMGDKLGTRLSLSQLKRLDELGRLNGGKIGRMSISEIARSLTDARDPALVAEVVRAGVGCVL